nr:MAG TPA: E2F-associated phosphoprotein [Caudoviricetes sp.]
MDLTKGGRRNDDRGAGTEVRRYDLSGFYTCLLCPGCMTFLL